MRIYRRELFIFDIGGVPLALRMEDVEYILPASEITSVPKTAQFVLGLAAVRGKIMSVIDGGLRLRIQRQGTSYFVVCHVRGNTTAVLINRPLEAKNLSVKKIESSDVERILARHKLNPKMFSAAWEILKKKDSHWSETGRKFLEINTDQFVSDQMASKIIVG